jgi:hypothetical protein
MLPPDTVQARAPVLRDSCTRTSGEAFKPCSPKKPPETAFLPGWHVAVTERISFTGTVVSALVVRGLFPVREQYA